MRTVIITVAGILLCLFTVICYCLLVAASAADRELEEMLEERNEAEMKKNTT